MTLLFSRSSHLRNTVEESGIWWKLATLPFPGWFPEGGTSSTWCLKSYDFFQGSFLGSDPIPSVWWQDPGAVVWVMMSFLQTLKWPKEPVASGSGMNASYWGWKPTAVVSFQLKHPTEKQQRMINLANFAMFPCHLDQLSIPFTGAGMWL